MVIDEINQRTNNHKINFAFYKEYQCPPPKKEPLNICTHKPVKMKNNEKFPFKATASFAFRHSLFFFVYFCVLVNLKIMLRNICYYLAFTYIFNNTSGI